MLLEIVLELYSLNGSWLLVLSTANKVLNDEFPLFPWLSWKLFSRVVASVLNKIYRIRWN